MAHSSADGARQSSNQLVSQLIHDSMKRASWIRKMFEAGNEMKKKLGAENVFDLSLGNPVLEPPQEFFDALKEVAEIKDQGWHRYMANSGYNDVKELIAQSLNEQHIIPTQTDSINMCVGAGGGLNVVFKSILNPGDEVIIFSPFFVEYLFYIQNHGGVAKTVATDQFFDLDLDAINQAITHKTRAIVLCSPNNPTGTVFSKQKLDALTALLKEKSTDRPIVLISDEPYREIYYDDSPRPIATWDYPESIVIYSWSKSLSIPGDRIGYIAIHENISDPQLKSAMTFCTRILGFVNAPATMQHVVKKLIHVTPPVDHYKKLRDKLMAGLNHLGFNCVTPMGAFYAFPKVPNHYENDVAFVQAAQEARVLVVPGSGFGTPGYFRISYAVEEHVIDGALKQLAEVM